MMKRSLLLALAAGILFLTSGPAAAADQERARDTLQKQDQTQDQIYGSQLMTLQERIEHRAKLRAAKTDEQRQQIRAEHHERMKERARKQGVSLPDNPPARGGGMGPGGGMGAGGGRGR